MNSCCVSWMSVWFLLLLSFFTMGGGAQSLGRCDVGTLRVRWTLANRLYGFCVDRAAYVKQTTALMEARKPYWLAWFSLVTHCADVDRDNLLSKQEFSNFLRHRYVQYLPLTVERIDQLFDTYFNFTSSATDNITLADQASRWFDLETQEALGLEWDRWNIREDTCLDADEYMEGLCQKAVQSAALTFWLYDENDDRLVSADEYSHAVQTFLHRNQAYVDTSLILLDANKDNSIEWLEMKTFARMTLTVL